MLISISAPPLPHSSASFGTVAALCPVGDGLSGDPFGITDFFGAAVSYINAGKQQKIQKEQIGLERAALKQQKLTDAQMFAAEQAQARIAPDKQKREEQQMALYAVGAAAVVITGLLIYGAVKK